MTKDCNGCFGAAGDDCQRCQEEAEKKPEGRDSGTIRGGKTLCTKTVKDTLIRYREKP